MSSDVSPFNLTTTCTPEATSPRPSTNCGGDRTGRPAPGAAEVDRLVCALYGLATEEISVVEGNR
ncbi:hypothetical protein FO488_16705 [Geobacter sp. FeAm09]|uniref:hypothetical protein n=1 Tax=Geobacter sp. FeAm09 TaxID=2597769 RepID=UPI0011EE70AE|nr:hypothetical protein [Geobacter sp. FeAm09]QEM69630.1 hypothetical protein FO488_16705 [Geobacter sp. FeAm09]